MTIEDDVPGPVTEAMLAPWVKPRLFKFQVDKHLHLISPIDGPVAAMRAMIEYKEFHR